MYAMDSGVAGERCALFVRLCERLWVVLVAVARDCELGANTRHVTLNELLNTRYVASVRLRTKRRCHTLSIQAVVVVAI